MARVIKLAAIVLLVLLTLGAGPGPGVAAGGRFQRGRLKQPDRQPTKDLTPSEKAAPARPRDAGQEIQLTARERTMIIPGIARPQAFVRVLRQLELTAEQQEKMLALRGRVGNQIPVLQRLRKAQNDALDEAIYSMNFDPKVVEQRAADLAATQAELTKLLARVMGEIRQILTPEQAVRFRELLIQERDRPAAPPPTDQTRPQNPSPEP